MAIDGKSELFISSSLVICGVVTAEFGTNNRLVPLSFGGGN